MKVVYERDSVEIIIDKGGILCLDEKHIEEGLYHKYLRMTTVKYPSDYRINQQKNKNKTTQQKFYTK